jgi:hypothetical protein
MSEIDSYYPVEELSPESREEIKNKIREFENNILSQINKYNEEIKTAEKNESNLRNLQNNAYSTSKRLRNALRSLTIAERDNLESHLNTLDSEIQLSLSETLNSKNVALTTLQHLYRDHIDYLSQIINGLKTRCEMLEKNSFR